MVDPPTVVGTPVRERRRERRAPGAQGETVGVTVTFSEAVNVDTSGGTPSIGIGLGGTAARSATYASGTGTMELVFGYTLVQGDGSHSLMAVTPASLALNGGTIRSAANQTNAQLAHNGTVVLGSSTLATVPEPSAPGVPDCQAPPACRRRATVSSPIPISGVSRTYSTLTLMGDCTQVFGPRVS